MNNVIDAANRFRWRQVREAGKVHNQAFEKAQLAAIKARFDHIDNKLRGLFKLRKPNDDGPDAA